MLDYPIIHHTNTNPHATMKKLTIRFAVGVISQVIISLSNLISPAKATEFTGNMTITNINSLTDGHVTEDPNNNGRYFVDGAGYLGVSCCCFYYQYQ